MTHAFDLNKDIFTLNIASCIIFTYYNMVEYILWQNSQWSHFLKHLCYKNYQFIQFKRILNRTRFRLNIIFSQLPPLLCIPENTLANRSNFTSVRKLQRASRVFCRYNWKLFTWLLQSKQDTTLTDVFICSFMHLAKLKSEEAVCLKQLEKKKQRFECVLSQSPAPEWKVKVARVCWGCTINRGFILLQRHLRSVCMDHSWDYISW